MYHFNNRLESINKNGNLLRYVDIDSLIGLQIIRKLKEQNSTVQNEINKIETACQQGKN